jgi:hypothetical protein
MPFPHAVVVELLDGTRQPGSACTPAGLALLPKVMPVLAYLGAGHLVDLVARALALAVHERRVKMGDALAATNHEVAFTRELALLYDAPLPRFQRAGPDAEPTHFVAARVTPGGGVERVRVLYRSALRSIASSCANGSFCVYPESLRIGDRVPESRPTEVGHPGTGREGMGPARHGTRRQARAAQIATGRYPNGSLQKQTPNLGVHRRAVR